MSGVPLHVHPADPASARAAIYASLSLPLSIGDAELGYEMLRAVTWSSTQGRTPVHVRTLLDRAMDAHMALTLGIQGREDETVREDLRSKLVELSRLGDIAELDNGRWISVPGVLVHVPGKEPDLLISGIPLCRLAPHTRRAVECQGAARFVRDAAADDAPNLPRVRLEDWSRRPLGKLKDWTRAMLSTPVLPTGTIVKAGMELYVPSQARPNAYQAERWAAPGRVPDGTYLARRTLAKHWRSYSLAGVESENITGVWEIDPLLARRLMYGIDQLDHNPTVAQWDEIDQGVALSLFNPLPAPEARALLALARPHSADQPGSWQIDVHRSAVRQLLDDLAITLTSGRRK
ncbi:hypothetical protein SAMN02799641_05903 [Rhodococcus erythropolis]|nr:hypothetical protein SAMN02799641_05903 [Rhodococcus erythropolis]